MPLNYEIARQVHLRIRSLDIVPISSQLGFTQPSSLFFLSSPRLLVDDDDDDDFEDLERRLNDMESERQFLIFVP